MSEAQVRTVEEWATEKGFLPVVFPGKPGAVGANGHARLGTADRPNRKTWQFAAARAHRRWVEGSEVTEAEFDAAIEAVLSVVLR